MSSDFEPDLDWSYGVAGMPFWDEVYKQAFPGFVASHIPTGDGWHQRAGRDRVIVLDDSTTITVDEKGRRDKWPDILIEVLHDRDRRVPGWGHPGKRLGCDYIGYAFVPTRQVHLVPYRELRRVMSNGPGRDWWRAAQRALAADDRASPIKFVDARNPRDTTRPVRYWTRSLAVPPGMLLDAIRDSFTFSFSPDAPLAVDPEPTLREELIATDWPETARPPDWRKGAA